MLSEQIYFGDNDPEWGQDTTHVYTRAPCIAMKRSIPLKEAMLLISESADRHNSVRSARFKEAREAKRTEFKGLTHEGLRKVTLDDLNEFFFPVVDLIIRN